MARVALEIDKVKLENSIKKIQKAKKFSGLVDFWEKVADDYGGVSSATLKSRAKAWGLTVDVERKRIAGNANMEKVRASKGEGKPRKRKKIDTTALRERLVDHQQQGLFGVADRLEKGNYKAATKLHCLDCCGYSKSAVKDCRSFACAFYGLRPYQKSVDEIDEVEEGEES